MSYSTPHAIQRFKERVNCQLPKKKKQKEKFIEEYLKKAYNRGTLLKNIQNDSLKWYMKCKLEGRLHYHKANRIVLYNENIFLFGGRQCITILNLPKDIDTSEDSIVSIDNAKRFINNLKEPSKVKKYLLKNVQCLEATFTNKKLVLKHINSNYSEIINNFPINAINYIKNDEILRNAIIKANISRNEKIKNKYYYIMSLLFLFPKLEVLKVHKIFRVSFKNNDDRFNISEKQINVCYKQLSILLGRKLKPQLEDFKVTDDICKSLLIDYINIKSEKLLYLIRNLYKE